VRSPAEPAGHRSGPAAAAGGRWGLWLAALVAVRWLFPLAALAASGRALPGLPHYDYGYRGDASGYYSTARAILSGVPGLGAALVPLVLALAGGLWLCLRVGRRRPGLRPVALIVALVLVFGAAAAVVAAGAAASVGALGWPLLWAVPMAPLRVANVISERSAFPFGLGLSLLANAATLVAVAYAGLYATGRRAVGLLAAALWALWPLLSGLVAGHGAASNGTWEADTGLALYTEPLSTALCTVTVALVLRPRRTATGFVLAGLAAGYATLTRPTNALLAALVVAVVLARRGVRPAALVAGGGVSVVPAFLAFLPKRHGYALSGTGETGVFTGFSAHNVASTFTGSPLWGGRALGALLPPALLGLGSVGGEAAALLGGWVALNTAFYAFVPTTAETPRYLFAALPALLVLWAAGASTAVRALVAYARPRAAARAAGRER
jgi:hypothetical protein